MALTSMSPTPQPSVESDGGQPGVEGTQVTAAPVTAQLSKSKADTKLSSVPFHQLHPGQTLLKRGVPDGFIAACELDLVAGERGSDKMRLICAALRSRIADLKQLPSDWNLSEAQLNHEALKLARKAERLAAQSSEPQVSNCQNVLRRIASACKGEYVTPGRLRKYRKILTPIEAQAARGGGANRLDSIDRAEELNDRLQAISKDNNPGTRARYQEALYIKRCLTDSKDGSTAQPYHDVAACLIETIDAYIDLVCRRDLALASGDLMPVEKNNSDLRIIQKGALALAKAADLLAEHARTHGNLKEMQLVDTWRSVSQADLTEIA